MDEYPKWVAGFPKNEWGQETEVRLVVDSPEQEASCTNKTAILKGLKSAQGDSWRWAGDTAPADAPQATTAKKK